jgi:NAD(P)-dependent dehydrogenase (short-subunit alcohol dehydrogenase family)
VPEWAAALAMKAFVQLLAKGTALAVSQLERLMSIHLKGAPRRAAIQRGPREPLRPMSLCDYRTNHSCNAVRRSRAQRGLGSNLYMNRMRRFAHGRPPVVSASKHAVEAVAETMSLELQEFGIEVATINPGPFLTGFNDRGFETWKSWEDDPSDRLFDYSKLAFAVSDLRSKKETFGAENSKQL